MPELLLTDKCNQTHSIVSRLLYETPQKSNFLSREYIAEVVVVVAWETPVERRVRFEQKLMALWLRGKRAPHGGVGPIYRVTWCRMVLYKYIALYSIVYIVGWLPYRGGRVSSISDSPISCHTASEILSSRRKSKRRRSLVWTQYRDIWNKILAVSRPQIWTQWRHDQVFFGDQRFVTIFVILRCHRFLCEGVAQIKEVSSGGNKHMFLCKLSHRLLRIKTHISQIKLIMMIINVDEGGLL